MDLGRKDYRSPSPKEGDPDASTGAIRENGEITPVDRAARRASFANIIHRRGPSDSRSRGDGKAHEASETRREFQKKNGLD